MPPKARVNVATGARVRKNIKKPKLAIKTNPPLPQPYSTGTDLAEVKYQASQFRDGIESLKLDKGSFLSAECPPKDRRWLESYCKKRKIRLAVDEKVVRYHVRFQTSDMQVAARQRRLEEARRWRDYW